MKKITITTAAAGILAASALGLASAAAAAPLEGMSAADAIKSLQDQGYSVQVNGLANAPLSKCKVTGVHGLSGSMPKTQLDTVYVDISCPTISS
jgi:hypothetical protein